VPNDNEFWMRLFRPRILTPSNTSNISLEVGKKVIDDFHGLIYDSACLEEDPQPFLQKEETLEKNTLNVVD